MNTLMTAQDVTAEASDLLRTSNKTLRPKRAIPFPPQVNSEEELQGVVSPSGNLRGL
jgi:hypothetical protein